MALKVRFYKFNKRPNSTKIPAATDTYKELDCTLKQSCSMIYPILNLNIAAIDVGKYNYAYIPTFSRYYFIDDVVYSAGIFTWDIYMHVDVLGSFKYDIGQSNQYISRAASATSSNIIDTMYPIYAGGPGGSQNWTYKTSELASDQIKAYPTDDLTGSTVTYFNVPITSGRFIVGVTGNGNSGVTYYDISYNRFKSFIKNCFDFNPSSSDMSSLDSGLSNAIWSPIDYITYCRWFPDVTISNTSGTTSSTNVGRYSINFGGSVNILSTKNVTKYTCELDIPDHPKKSTVGNYMNLSPFREVSLYMPSFGFIPVDTEKIFGSSKLRLNWFTDYMTGNAVLQLVRETTGEPDTILYVANGEIGIPISISTLQYGFEGIGVNLGADLIKTAFNSGMSMQQAAKDLGGSKLTQLLGAGADLVRSTIKSEITSGNIAAVGQIADATIASMGQLKTTGTAGSFMTYNMSRPSLHVWAKYTTVQDKDRFGSPYYAISQLNQLSGFFSCINANIASWPQGIPTSPEYDAIIGYLNGGAFWE